MAGLRASARPENANCFVKSNRDSRELEPTWARWGVLDRVAGGCYHKLCRLSYVARLPETLLVLTRGFHQVNTALKFFFVVAALNCPSLAGAVEYTFSRIYTGAAYPGVAINDNGLVALIGGNYGDSLITTDGVTSTQIAGWPSANRLDGNPFQVLSLNNSGFVAFRGQASHMGGSNCVLMASNGAITRTIAADKIEGGTFDWIPWMGAMSINDSGMVAFEAQMHASTPPTTSIVGRRDCPSPTSQCSRRGRACYE